MGGKEEQRKVIVVELEKWGQNPDVMKIKRNLVILKSELKMSSH